jgi:hypothetical protein
MTHEAFQVNGENIELYVSQRFFVLKREGDPDFFFTMAPVGGNFEAEEQETVPGEIQTLLSVASFSQMTLKLHGILSKLMMTMNPHQKTLLW